MDSNQLVKATQRLETGLTRYENGSVITHGLIVALQGDKIAFCEDEEIKKPLRYAMLLIGLKSATIDAQTDEEKAVMINYLRKYFGGHTCQEIRLAFEMALAGQLPIAEKDVKAYENFSTGYVTGILNAYRKWAKVEAQQIPPPKELPKPQLTPEQREVENKRAYEYWKQYLLNGQDINYVPSLIYDLVQYYDKVPPTDEEIGKTLTTAHQHALVLYADEKRELEKLNGPQDVWQELPYIQKLAKSFWCKAFFIKQALAVPSGEK